MVCGREEVGVSVVVNCEDAAVDAAEVVSSVVNPVVAAVVASVVGLLVSEIKVAG